jgi:hypothetical protein
LSTIGENLRHYEISRQLGRGGMGKGYQAKDQKLGPYEILASIGAGGMGEVYRGSDCPSYTDFDKLSPVEVRRYTFKLKCIPREEH